MNTIKKLLMTLVIAIMGSVVALANFPNGTWDLDCSDGFEYDGYERFVSRFATPDPQCKILNVAVPYGYYEYGYEGGDCGVFVFSMPKIEGNIARFTVTPYEYVYEDFGEILKPTNQDSEVWKAVYNSSDNSVTVGESVFKDPDRQRWVVSWEAHNVNIRKAPLNGAVIGKAPKGKTFKLLGKQEVKKRDQYSEYDETWYKIDLGNGDTGFVTSEYFIIAADYKCDPSRIPVDALIPNKDYCYDLMTYTFQREVLDKVEVPEVPEEILATVQVTQIAIVDEVKNEVLEMDQQLEDNTARGVVNQEGSDDVDKFKAVQEDKAMGDRVMCMKNIMNPTGHGMAADFYYLGKINGNGIEWYKTLRGNDGYEIFESSDFEKFEILGEPYERRGKNSLFPEDLYYYNDVIFEDGNWFTINNDW